LDTEVIEVEVGTWIKRFSQTLQVEPFQQHRIQSLDLHAAFEVLFESAFMRFFQLANAIAHDVPIEDFFVDVGENNPAGKLGEIRIMLNQALGIEDDRPLKIGFLHLAVNRSAQFGFDLLVGQREVETDDPEFNPLLQVDPVPKLGRSVGQRDQDHAFLAVIDNSLTQLLIPQVSAVGAVKDVRFGHFEVPLTHELLLHYVLNILDMDPYTVERTDSFRHALSHRHGGM